MKFPRLAVTLFVILVLLAACGTDAGDGDAADPPPADTGEATPEDGADAEAEDDEGASPPADGADAGGDAEADQVTLAIGSDTKTTPIFVGQEKGIFLEHGIDLEFLLLPTGTEMSTALQAGQAQFAAPAISNAPVAREQGIDEVAFVGKMGDPTVYNFDDPLGVLGRPGSDVQEGDVTSLRGARIGISVGGTGDQYLRALLDAHGVSADEVQFVNLTGAGDFISAFRGGSVDAIAHWEPQLSELIVNDDAFVVARNGNYIAYVIFIYAARDLIENDPDLVQRFATAVAESSHYTRHNLDEAAAISARRLDIDDEEIVRMALDNEFYDPRITDNSTAAWSESVELLIEQEKLDEASERTSIEQSFDTTFIDQVQAEHPEFFEDLEPLE